MDITYFDGFNRPLQEIQVNGSASTVTDALNVTNWNTYGTDEMAYAFSQTDYEASPLNRILKQTGEGQAWHTRKKALRMPMR